MTPLCVLGMKHGTDKVGWHNYTPVYYDLLKDRKVERLLEIGIGWELVVVQNIGRPYKAGASLFMWEEFFPDAAIFGIDMDARALVGSNRIRSVQLNQNDGWALGMFAENNGPFDVIIDDGSHVPEHQITSMKALLPFLSDDGIYIIEDVYSCESFIVGSVPEGFTCRHVDAPGPNPPGFLLVIERTK